MTDSVTMPEPTGMYQAFGPPAGTAPSSTPYTSQTAPASTPAPAFSYTAGDVLGQPGVQSEVYCAAQDNTWPATGTIAAGTAIPQGTMLELVAGQPSWDSHYTGATPAIYVVGTGLTCDNPPAGDVLQGVTDSVTMPEPTGMYQVFGPPAG